LTARNVRRARWREPSIAPPTGGAAQTFRVTHPFHPLRGRTFQLIECRQTWGEYRVSQCPAVESVPDRVGGAWVFRGTRLPVATVIENLEDLSIDEVMEQFVTREQITAVLDFVAESLRAESIPAGARPL
jgi:uncharacterized protein (DUF433 family)